MLKLAFGLLIFGSLIMMESKPGSELAKRIAELAAQSRTGKNETQLKLFQHFLKIKFFLFSLLLFDECFNFL